MNKNNKIILFEGQNIRRFWDEKAEKWYFSVVDVILILTSSTIPKRYWSDLKNKLKREGSQVYDKIVHLRFLARDGKVYQSDAADVETIMRLIQSVPSPKAEPFKLWLAKVGYERLMETADPEQSLSRARENWQKMGRSQKWIQQRMMGQETRNKLTDYWQDHAVTRKEEFAVLTNIIHSEWSDLSVKEHRELKKLKSGNLRDHMTEAELIFTALAEFSTREVAENMKAIGLEENKIPARIGGRVSKNARLELEQKTGRKVVSENNFKIQEKQKRKKIK